MTNIYIVKQYQSSEAYLGEPIAVFDTLEKALKQVKKLNKEYAKNVEFGHNYFSFYTIDDFKDYHAYTIEALELNKEIPFWEL